MRLCLVFDSRYPRAVSQSDNSNTWLKRFRSGGGLIHLAIHLTLVPEQQKHVEDGRPS